MMIGLLPWTRIHRDAASSGENGGRLLEDGVGPKQYDRRPAVSTRKCEYDSLNDCLNLENKLILKLGPSVTTRK